MTSRTRFLSRLLALSLTVLVASGCQKNQVHGAGYGGSDGLTTQLVASRKLVQESVNRWSRAGADARWCEPTRCEEYPKACQIVKSLLVDKPVITGYLARGENSVQWTERILDSVFKIENDLVKEGVGTVDALTPLNVNGSYVMLIHRDRMEKKSSEEIELTLGHEFGHAVINKDDGDSYYGMKAMDFLDGVSACLQLGPTIVKAEPSPTATPESTPSPTATPTSTPTSTPLEDTPENPTPEPTPELVSFSVVETYANQKAARADAIAKDSGTNGLSPTRIFSTDLSPGKRLVLTSASGLNITRIFPDGSENIIYSSPCPKNWKVHFRRADGTIINPSAEVPDDIEAYQAGVLVPMGAASAFIGLRKACALTGTCDYSDAEGVRWTTNLASTGGCDFSFRLEWSEPKP